MGVAKMNLGKWDEAKRYLRTAARELRKLPDPKSHLGVTYAKLGDIDGANAQRARLVKMAEACKGTCELSPYITSGIEMIDEALAEPPAPEAAAQG
jgi:predicted Zn-dependent protease